MVKFIDSHTHLYSDKFEGEVSDVIERAVKSGVGKLLLPNIDDESVPSMFALVDKYPDVCYPMLGLHPTDVDGDYISKLDSIESHFSSGVIAVGEIGIDLYWDKTYLKEQKEALKIQLGWAESRNLPVALHVRDSFDDTFPIVETFAKRGLKGVFHSFTGTLEQAEKILDLGFLIGVNGIVTFKNGGVNKIVEAIGIDNLILETDSPYLAPVPYRGKRNESSYIVDIADCISDICQIPIEDVAAKTTENCLKLFNL